MTINDGIILTFILIGIIIIIVSFLLDKYQGHITRKEQERFELKENRRIDYDEVIQKIIELNEYGEFLKADLDKRQKELVFMYQMLLEKQKELTTNLSKTTVSSVNTHSNVTEVKTEEKAKIPISQNVNNNNAKIIEMTLEGYTSTEIAKALNIGKGQVELVQNLYR